MTLEAKFIIFQILIILPFVGGKYLSAKISGPSEKAKVVVRTNLIFIEPPVILWSIWGTDLNMDIFFLPAAGLVLVLTGFFTGYIVRDFLSLKGTEGPTFIISSSLANHGFTLGAFICYLFGGEKGLALAAIFLTYFIPYTFIVIFSYARAQGQKYGNMEKIKISIKKYFLDWQNMPLYTVFAAIALKAFGIERPEIPFPTDLFVMMSIIAYYFTLGMNFSFSGILRNLPAHGILAAEKFLFLPLLAFIALSFVNLEKEVESVILVQSFMPAAVYSVVSSIIFDLDSPFASGLFLVNTVIFILLVLPILFMLSGTVIF